MIQAEKPEKIWLVKKCAKQEKEKDSEQKGGTKKWQVPKKCRHG